VKHSSILAALFLVPAFASACHHDQEAKGPFERAGAGLDRASDKTGQALSTAATTTGAAVQKAGEATGKALGKAGDKLDGKSSPSGPQPTVPSEKKPE
jgi:hypothetical protein